MSEARTAPWNPTPHKNKCALETPALCWSSSASEHRCKRWDWGNTLSIAKADAAKLLSKAKIVQKTQPIQSNKQIDLMLQGKELLSEAIHFSFHPLANPTSRV